jgi:hypothetical protein
MPKVSRARSRSAGTVWSPLTIDPASEESVSASAVALAERRESPNDRSTAAATVPATTANTRVASKLSSVVVKALVGGMNQ